jgi:hypothetical protein
MTECWYGEIGEEWLVSALSLALDKGVLGRAEHVTRLNWRVMSIVVGNVIFYLQA